MFSSLGSELERLCKTAKHEVVLVAPFIKHKTLSHLLDIVDVGIHVRCITRWRPDEIILGVSDIEIWLLLRDRANASLQLRSDLHAKYYRGDQQVLIGSANLTNAALGWSKRTNLEILIHSDPISDFERELFTGSVEVDDSLYQHIKQIVDALPTQITPLPEDFVPELVEVDEVVSIPVEAWLPILRHPENLYKAYIGDWDQLGTGSRIGALSDLQALGIPRGLNREQFEAYVGVQILQKPVIRRVDEFIKTPQRFGSVRDFLKTLPCANQDNFNANNAWQTLMRWLLYFLDSRFKLKKPNYSEIIFRVD